MSVIHGTQKNNACDSDGSWSYTAVVTAVLFVKMTHFRPSTDP